MKKKTNKPRKRGFSLQELAIVMVIMGVVLALALPRFNVIMERFYVARQVPYYNLIYDFQVTTLKETGFFTAGDPSPYDAAGQCTGGLCIGFHSQDLEADGIWSTDVTVHPGTQAFNNVGEISRTCDEDGQADPIGVLAWRRRGPNPWGQPYQLLLLQDGRVGCYQDSLMNPDCLTGQCCITGACARTGLPVW